MKTILTVSIILNIAFLVIGNNDMKLLNLRGAHHSHQHARGDSNKLSSDIQVSRLLKVSFYSVISLVFRVATNFYDASC